MSERIAEPPLADGLITEVSAQREIKMNLRCKTLTGLRDDRTGARRVSCVQCGPPSMPLTMIANG